jgi:4-amino-4-deoxy-L-arabinose transferase-like glycosyltransferase
MDWSKYTDEGWYGDAAIRFYQLGNWYLPGDFNPAIALPVWPLLEGMLFRFTGVSLVAERALTVVVFGGILIVSWFLVARSSPAHPYGSLAGSAAVLLLAVNPFCFVFTRIGILEPLLVLLMLLALLVAQNASCRQKPSAWGAGIWRFESARRFRANLFQILALGLLLPLLILTKTTALFLVPAIALMLFAALSFRLRSFLQVGLSAGALGLALWLSYYSFAVRPYFLSDYRYLFSANAYTGIDRGNWLSVIFWTVHGGAWIGRFLFTLALAAIGWAVINLRRLRDCPVVPVLILWATGYGAFLAYHNNLQPRYYLVIAVPLTLLVPVVWRDLLAVHLHTRFAAAGGTLIAALLLVFCVVPEAVQTLEFVEHPQYTYVDAAWKIKSTIDSAQGAEPDHSALVLSISGSDLSLMTGLHSICDDFGTLELADRVDRYKPGWYVAWNLIEDDKMDVLAPRYRVTRVATFPAMDDQDRNVLILYRLDPENSKSAEEGRRGRAHRFRNKAGQQPSPIQLEH